MKKIVSIGVVVLAVGMLAACGNQSSSSSKTSDQESSSRVASSASSKTSSTTTTSSSESHHDDALWNNKKNEQLQSFINQWAPTMHQSYTRYDGQNELKVSTGVSYPADLV